MSEAPRALHRSVPHESAALHVTGTARYTDDLPAPPGLLHGWVVPAPAATGTLRGVDAAPALAVPGVVAVLTAADIPGRNRIGPIVHDEPLLCDGPVACFGQAVAFVVAESREAARLGAAAVRVDLAPGPAPVVSLAAALDAGRFLTAPHTIARGDPDAAIAAAALVLEGTVDSPAQDHFYLETHVARALPDGEGGLHIVSSTQHPTEIQAEVAAVLGWDAGRVVCEVPRMGGGFGGKESQATSFACLAALAAVRTGRPVSLRLDRGQDMSWTGKRHPFHARYRAGFAADGALLGYTVELFSDGGWSLDLSGAVMDRALFHLDAGMYVPALRFTGRVCRTDLPSNTAFRGFGGPQGALVTHTVLHRAAVALGLPLEAVLLRNAYGPGTGTTAPYGQEVRAPRGAAMLRRLLTEAEVSARRAEITAFNAGSAWRKRGLGLMLVQFGISFTNSLLNQAGALVHIYTDGSVQVNHGGTEMGQGLHTKIQAIAADALGVPPARVRVTATRTDKVPNTSATAASSGTDLNGAAVAAACATLRARLEPVAAGLLGGDGPVRFADGLVHGAGGASVPFAAVARAAWVARVSLSATGHHATPGIAYDRDAGCGTPFFYYAWGVCAAEVELCGLTGEHALRRVDILHDCGDSLNPAIDRGQVEGAFIQGLGWLTAEEVRVSPDGRPLTRGPSTYKVPSAGDLPADWRVRLLDDAAQPGVVGGSKAVGEPPFLLAMAVPAALREAVAAFGAHPASLALPATPEHLLAAVTAARGASWG